MLNYGLVDWGGPSHCTDAFATAMGFTGLHGIESEAATIAAAIRAGEPLSVRDWTRALISTEVIFASEVVGTGGGWTSIQGGSDEHWVGVLRRLQHKVPHSRDFLAP